MKAGKEYELLVERMYRELEPNAIITHDDHIYDERAQIKRQIDVSIKYQFAGVDNLIIVQVKDYKNKANIAVVDEFQTVINDVKANKGILICSKGFSTAAINKAKSYGIECLTVHSALKKNWETLVKIQIEKIFHCFELNMEFKIEIPKNNVAEYVDEDFFSYDCKNIISITDIVYDHIIQKNAWDYIKKKHIIRLYFKDIEVFYFFNNEMLPVKIGYVEIKYLLSDKSNFFVTPSNYIFEKNHTQNSSKLHNLTIKVEKFDSLIMDYYPNDKEAEGSPQISLKVFYFKNINKSHVTLNAKTDSFIEGYGYWIKDRKLMKENERALRLIEIENILLQKNS